jgi:hypothetical protein
MLTLVHASSSTRASGPKIRAMRIIATDYIAGLRMNDPSVSTSEVFRSSID